MPAEEDGYTGPAKLVVGEREFAVDVEMRGHFQPIDGRYHWYGRVARHDDLEALLGGRKRAAEIHTPDGSARGELSDPDPWGRYRILGASTPPFTVPTTPAE
ncbi:DUF4873 domain-containing protein [Amycolatopsis alkalitolerans]|uniref:DUF4873 domain-containing protein n=1 Tax=Amycolatopsis alkalitolerans TaxID=2547244 RepID=A0A5C4LWV3_9PSEU|nr:DUF4873 domain-containing protein [Amycolatopsis alkalitolerans]TNC23197.1 DUF4873 domain-containing protein [Amycolatopsis alkalitolerans]